jgi:hypothetical protein
MMACVNGHYCSFPRHVGGVMGASLSSRTMWVSCSGSEEGAGGLIERRKRMGLKPGQLDPQTAEVNHRMRELAGRKAYLRNFWYAAGRCPSCHCPASLACSGFNCKCAALHARPLD